MKKLIFGITLFVTGYFSAIALIASTIFSPLAPWDYMGIDGWLGVVLGMKLQLPLIICVVVAVAGAVLCTTEILQKSKKAKDE